MASASQYSLTTNTAANGSPAFAITSSATKSIWLLNPVTNQFNIFEFGVGFDSSTSNQGIRVDLYTVVTIGSAAGTAGIVNKMGTTTNAATTTGLVQLTVEPTTVTVWNSWIVNPASGELVIQYPLGREMAGIGAGSARIGLRYSNPNATFTPNCTSYCNFEE